MCIRDNDSWKRCDRGHEPADWVRIINEAYEKKNADLFSSSYNPLNLHATSSYPAPPYVLHKRQQGSNTSSSDGSQTQPPSSQTSEGQPQGAPLSVFTFIIAIALFVLVVSFVLLRIFVRNRRLRRMGIYPEGPIERLLGGPTREIEDTLPPPRLWDAKIADVQASNSGAMAKAEKNVLGGGIGAGDVEQHGWDALMPVSAAFPPNLYPLLYRNEQAPITPQPNTTEQQDLPAISAATGVRMGRRHVPNFLRRAGGEDEVTSPAGNPPEYTSTAMTSEAFTGSNCELSQEEKVNASVNVTVLIAMPSHSTVFPTTSRKVNMNASTHSFHRSNSHVDERWVVPTNLERVEDEDENVDHDSQSAKGKSRRAPSLRSVRSVASSKSQGAARRNAFFDQKSDEKNPPLTLDAPTFSVDDEELPELVFGTASVPLYLQTTPSLTQPSRDDIMQLVTSSAEARQRKASQGIVSEGKKEEEEPHIALSGTALHLQDGSRNSEAFEMDTLSRPSIPGGPSNVA